MTTVDCRPCDGSGSVDGDWCYQCSGQGFLYCCSSCHDPITGCIWNGGQCLDCHEGALLPVTAADLWDAEYAV